MTIRNACMMEEDLCRRAPNSSRVVTHSITSTQSRTVRFPRAGVFTTGIHSTAKGKAKLSSSSRNVESGFLTTEEDVWDESLFSYAMRVPDEVSAPLVRDKSGIEP